MTKDSNRRDFIEKTVLLSTGIMLCSNFVSCNKEASFSFGGTSLLEFSNDNFDHGVASFDPTASQIIIWTRYSSQENSETIHWQLATDAEFSDITREGAVITDESRDYTVSIEIQNLEADQKLYYRFFNQKNEHISIIGETITLPVVDVTQINLGVTSCSNLSYGNFNVYNAIANSKIDIVVHLGDYIYENGPITPFDNLSPPNETIALNDYRLRYKQYRSNTDLKLLHARKPFICVWDDHEIADNSFKDGADNHQANEGDFQTRKQEAIQAYSEYLPMLTNNTHIIYRSFQIGQLLNLTMLDTRLIGRDAQLHFGDFQNSSGALDLSSFQASLQNPNRSMLGEAQKNWLLQELENSSAKWQIIGQQVLMGKMMIPTELLLSFQKIQNEGSINQVSQESLAAFLLQIEELVTLKKRIENNDPTVTEFEKARMNLRVPYNLDAWDGYPVEREILLNTIKNKKVVVLAGDSHNAWQNDLYTASGDLSGVELATASVSSPGIEYLIEDQNSLHNFEELFTELIDNLNYLNASDKGYTEVTIRQTDIKVNWIYVSSITEENYQTETKKSMTFV